jgi:hypothetical protein
MSRARGAIAGTLILALVIAGLAVSAATRADAAPPGIIGPVETFTATVVEGTIVPVGVVVRFSAERPALTNPAQLEHLTVETAQASLVIPNEILSITGNYDTDIKIFKATSMVSLGTARPAPPTAAGAPTTDDNDNSDDEDNDNAAGGDNDNAGGGDNGNDNN